MCRGRRGWLSGVKRFDLNCISHSCEHSERSTYGHVPDEARSLTNPDHISCTCCPSSILPSCSSQDRNPKEASILPPFFHFHESKIPYSARIPENP